MEHNEASKSNAVERYILGEMSNTERESFEAHFFECRECARDLQMTEIFRANAKAVFEDRAKLPIPVAASLWQRVSQPVLAIAAALLLAVGSFSAYQNLVTIPRLSQIVENSRSAQPLQSVVVSSVTRGQSPISTVAPEVKNVAVPIQLPPDWHYQRYRVTLAPECGPIATAGPLELPAPERGLPLQFLVLASRLNSGTCQMTLDGLSSDSWEENLGSFSFKISKD